MKMRSLCESPGANNAADNGAYGGEGASGDSDDVAYNPASV